MSYCIYAIEPHYFKMYANMNLDQYYTKPDVAKECLRKLLRVFPRTKSTHFLEPSAGDGSFYFLLPETQRTGVDIAPQAKGIKKADFLKWKSRLGPSEKVVVIGNPPFGHRSRTAIAFFNRAATMADTIAFIVPRQFQKYSVHSKLDKDFRLIKDFEIEENSFYTPDGKDFGVRCVFQIWTRKKTRHKDLRLKTPPPIAHLDFTMYQYNNTKEALKVFKYDWEFAVPRQGYEDYRRRETRADKCEKNKQWILFKPHNDIARERLLKFDFVSLAKKNTAIYGFGKADVVMEYNRRYA